MLVLNKYLEMQHQVDIDDVKENCTIDDFPEEMSAEKADNLLHNSKFIEEVADCYRHRLDDNDGWYYILKGSLMEVAQKYL